MSRLGFYAPSHVSCWRRDDLDLRDSLPCARIWYVSSDRCPQRSACARAPQRRPRGRQPFCVVVLAEGLSTPPTPPASRRLVHQCRVALCHVKVAMLAGQRRLICTPLFSLRGSLRGTRDSEGLQPVSHFSSNCSGGKMAVKPTNRNAVLFF